MHALTEVEGTGNGLTIVHRVFSTAGALGRCGAAAGCHFFFTPGQWTG
jgi:hypothetical protein